MTRKQLTDNCDEQNEAPTYVTMPYLPPLDEFMPYLEAIWRSRRLTNKGPFHQQFEEALAEYLGVPHLSLFANGTMALVTALQALKITGEVITTPYSFVATCHALLWNNITPVFVDIAPRTFNLDANRIEAAITPKTSAILPVHCYGNPCDVEPIQKIADTYGLKTVYDGAHAFGVRVREQSVFSFGDLSILSFHATKVFNTFEGGAIVCHDAKTKQRIDYLKNFGFADETTVVASGINGKMNEFQAALGILQLQHMEAVLERRKQIDSRYRRGLRAVSGINVSEEPASTLRNYAYFPIRVTEAYFQSRNALYERLRRHGIFARRYFFPLISSFPMYRGLPSADPKNLFQAQQAASEILCLPIYPDLPDPEVDRVIDLIGFD